MFEREKEEVSKRVKMIANTKLSDANLIKVINMEVIPVAVYTTNICKCVRQLRENSKEKTCWESREL